MANQLYTEDEYKEQLYDLLHCSLDRLIDLGSRLEAIALLMAQLGVDGAEEEIEATQELVKIVSRIMIIRNARDIIQSSQAS